MTEIVRKSEIEYGFYEGSKINALSWEDAKKQAERQGVTLMADWLISQSSHCDGHCPRSRIYCGILLTKSQLFCRLVQCAANAIGLPSLCKTPIYRPFFHLLS